MRLSVVIPTFDRARIVCRAIESALAQSMPADEVIVVDDGSRDDTHAVVKQYGGRVRYIYQTNAGVSAARNRGIEAAKGEWIAFLDSDDEWLTEKLAIQIREVSQRPDVHVHVANGAFVVDEREQIDLLQMRGETSLAAGSSVIERPFTRVLRSCFLMPGCVARRDLLIKAGLFNPQYSLFEDMDLYARMSVLSPFGVCGRPLVRVIRQGDPRNNLSRQGILNRAFAQETLISIFGNLTNFTGLNEDESRLLDKMLSWARFALAGEQFKMGRGNLARKSLLDSMRASVSIPSVGRGVLGLFFGGAGIAFAKMLTARRRSGIQVPGR